MTTRELKARIKELERENKKLKKDLEFYQKIKKENLL